MLKRWHEEGINSLIKGSLLQPDQSIPAIAAGHVQVGLHLQLRTNLSSFGSEASPIKVLLHQEANRHQKSTSLDNEGNS